MLVSFKNKSSNISFKKTIEEFNYSLFKQPI